METNALTIFPNIMQALADYAEEAKRLYKENLVKSDRLATEDLYNSIETEVEADGTTFLVTMTLADYWKWVEEDTRPHWPPRDAILQWIRVKPVIPRPGKNGSLPKPEQLAYLIGRKIARQGTTGSHDLRDALAELNARFESRLVDALAADIADLSHAYIIQLTHR